MRFVDVVVVDDDGVVKARHRVVTAAPHESIIMKANMARISLCNTIDDIDTRWLASLLVQPSTLPGFTLVEQ